MHFHKKYFFFLNAVESGMHTVLKNPLNEPFPSNMSMVMFGMGCYWGAERLFWRQPGVYSTQVGFSGGREDGDVSYRKVCSGKKLTENLSNSA